MTNFSENFCKKFGIIQARDYDKEAIKNAKKGIYNVYQNEFERIQKCTKHREKDFFKILDSTFNDQKNYITYKITPKEILTSKIEFKAANILRDYINIKKTIA